MPRRCASAADTADAAAADDAGVAAAPVDFSTVADARIADPSSAG